MKALTKKGNIGGLQGFIMGIGSVAITLAIVLVILGSIKDNSTSAAANTSIDTIVTKLGTIPNWIGILIVVAMATLVLSYFYLKR